METKDTRKDQRIHGRRYFRSILSSSPFCFLLGGVFLEIVFIHGIYVVANSIISRIDSGEGQIGWLIFALIGGCWALAFYSQLVWDSFWRPSAVFFRDSSCLFIRNFNVGGSEKPYIASESGITRYQRSSTERRRLGKGIEVRYDSILRIYHYPFWLAGLGLASTATYIDYRDSQGVVSTTSLKHTVDDFGLMLEKVLELATNIESIHMKELVTSDKDYQLKYWQKEPDWDIINAAIARAEENRKKKEQEQQS